MHDSDEVINYYLLVFHEYLMNPPQLQATSKKPNMNKDGPSLLENKVCISTNSFTNFKLN